MGRPRDSIQKSCGKRAWRRGASSEADSSPGSAAVTRQNLKPAHRPWRKRLPPGRRTDGVAEKRDAVDSGPDVDGDGGLIGRGRAWQELQRALQAAGDARGGLVLVAGEAGVGKTRLALE